ncbi:uncharacterized protein LOC144728057 isoform X6 [Lampetra planeri]
MALRPLVLCLLFSLMLWAEYTDAAPCDFNYTINSTIFNAEVTENSINNSSFFNIPVEGNIPGIVLTLIPNNIFKLQGKQLLVADQTALDRETLGETAILRLTCEFNGLINQARIAVKILDVNEFDPEFQGTPYMWHISEPGAEYFNIILPYKEDISLVKALKYEVLDALNLTTIQLIVYATDSNPSGNATGYPIRTGTATVTVSVIDQDDQPPIFQPKVCSTVASGTQLCVNAKYSATVRENELETNIVFAPAQIRAEDGDKGINATIKYTLLSDSVFFKIDENNGQISMKEAVPNKTEITLQIVAYQDDFQKFTITTATIKVVTKNEIRPAFSEEEYCGHVPNNADVIFATMCNSPNILQLQVNDADYAPGEHPIVEYTIVGEGKEHIEIHPNGYVLVRSSNLVAGQEYTFEIEAKDIENGDISQTRLTINVQAETTTAPTTTTPPTTATSATIPTTTRHVTANTGSAITNPGGNASPTTRPGGGVSPTTRPGGNVSPTTRPGGDVSPTTRPGGNVSPTTRPGGNVSPTTRPGGNPSPTTRPGGDLTTTTRSGGDIITTPRTDGPVSSSNRPESVSPGGGVTPTSNPADISTGSGISKVTTTLSTNAQQSTASTLSRPTGGITAKTTPRGAISSTTARPGGTGTTVNVPEGSTPQTTQGSDGPTVTVPQITAGGSDRPTVPGPQPTVGGSDKPTVTRPHPTAEGSDRPTATGPHLTAGGSDRPTAPVPQITTGGSDRPTVTGPHPTDGGSNRPTVPDPRPTPGGSDSPTLPDPRPTSGGPEKIYTAQDMAIVGGVLGALLAVALGVIGFLLFKVLSKKKKAVKIEDDAHYGGGGGDDDGYANSRKGSGQQDDISIGDMGRDDDLNMVNHYIHLPKDHMQDTDVDRSSGYNSVSGRPTTPLLEDTEEHSAPPPQPRDNPAFEADAVATTAAAATAAATAADDEQATHTKSILVTMNSNEKVTNDKAGYKAVWFKDEVIPDGGEAADEADGRAAGGVRFDGEPADDVEGKESSGAAVAGSGLDSSAMHTGGAVAEDDEFASL